MEPTLASQITGRQLRIPIDDISFGKIPVSGIAAMASSQIVPLRELGRIPTLPR
jgi:hypothetical protein